jgi:anti-sigma regulatory factor (Ser/Thr protein kinase)
MNTEQLNIEQYGECENLPNAAKLIQSLRHLDYDNSTAVNDLVDNSIDAGASHVWVDITPGSKSEVISIEIWDDGYGMDYEALDEALKLGSESGRNPSSDLGLYGMGLITASISMGERLEVMTKTKNSDLLLGIQDLKDVRDKNRFVKTIQKASAEQRNDLAKSFLGKFQTIGKISYLPDSFTKITIKILIAYNGQKPHLWQKTLKREWDKYLENLFKPKNVYFM